jgi:predicted ABC-type ATPase
MLNQLKELAAERLDFAFETTLAARTFAGWLESLRAVGYKIYLFYYWLDSANLAIARVAEWVKSGGHHVPDDTIRQRYTRSVRFFFDLYRPLADYWEVYDNSYGKRRLLAVGSREEEELTENEWTWDTFKRSGEL